jgi:hypothetical protein
LFCLHQSVYELDQGSATFFAKRVKFRAKKYGGRIIAQVKKKHQSITKFYKGEQLPLMQVCFVQLIFNPYYVLIYQKLDLKFFFRGFF